MKKTSHTIAYLPSKMRPPSKPNPPLPGTLPRHASNITFSACSNLLPLDLSLLVKLIHRLGGNRYCDNLYTVIMKDHDKSKWVTFQRDTL